MIEPLTGAVRGAVLEQNAVVEPNEPPRPSVRERAMRSRAQNLPLTPAEERALQHKEAFNKQQTERKTAEANAQSAAVSAYEQALDRARAAHHKASWQVEEARNAEVAARIAVRDYEAAHALRLDQAQRGLERSLRLAKARWRERVVNLRRDLVVAEKSGTAVSLDGLAAVWLSAHFDQFADAVREQLEQTPDGHTPLSTITDEEYAAGLEPLKAAHAAAKEALKEAQRAKDFASTRLANLELNLDLSGGSVA
jgi:hypothetical protein